jgi:hypothetical protein
MHSSCNLHDNHVSVVYIYRGCTQHNWAGMSSHVGFYMILVSDVRIKMWPGQISSDLFRSVWPSSVVRQTCSTWWHDFAVHAIVLFHWSRFTRSCYFIDRDLRDRDNLVGRGFELRTEQYDFLIGPGFDPRPDRLFQASVIRDLCHSPPQMVN